MELGNVIIRVLRKESIQNPVCSVTYAPATASIIHGLHNWVSLNFKKKMLAAASPTMTLIIFRIIKIQCKCRSILHRCLQYLTFFGAEYLSETLESYLHRGQVRAQSHSHCAKLIPIRFSFLQKSLYSLGKISCIGKVNSTFVFYFHPFFKG